MAKDDESERDDLPKAFALIDQLAQNGADVERRVEKLERRGIWNWFKNAIRTQGGRT